MNIKLKGKTKLIAGKVYLTKDGIIKILKNRIMFYRIKGIKSDVSVKVTCSLIICELRTVLNLIQGDWKPKTYSQKSII